MAPTKPHAEPCYGFGSPSMQELTQSREDLSLSLSLRLLRSLIALSLSLSLRVSKRGVTVHAYMEHASAPPSPPPLPPEHGMPLEMRAGSGGGIAGPRGAKAEGATKTK